MGAPGFDDAPLEQLGSRMLPRALTLIYPYYENPAFLTRQLDAWGLWSVELRALTRIIVVDDGSPSKPAEQPIREWVAFPGLAHLLNIELYRISVDVRWNWLAARNIGAHHAPQGWCLFTDMDHVVPEYTARMIVHAQLDEDRIYTFRRREYSGAEIHRHPNSMLMTRETFWRIGGYDEALSGHYGTDGDWRRRCAAAATVRCLDAFLERHEHQGDSSTTGYLRKQPEDAGKKKIIRARGPRWRPLALSFPYHRVPL